MDVPTIDGIIYMLVAFILAFHYLTNQLTQWSRVLEKPPVAQLLKNFPTFYGTRKLITVFITALHRSLSSATTIHPITFFYDSF
jgi:hypothetical protein